MIDLIPRPRWRAMSLCAGSDADVFFPGRGAATRSLRQICRACPVREACAAMGMGERYGFWGGLGERNRRTLRHHGEFVDAAGDTWLHHDGEVIVIENDDKPVLSPGEARALLERLQPASTTRVAVAVAVA